MNNAPIGLKLFFRSGLVVRGSESMAKMCTILVVASSYSPRASGWHIRDRQRVDGRQSLHCKGEQVLRIIILFSANVVAEAKLRRDIAARRKGLTENLFSILFVLIRLDDSGENLFLNGSVKLSMHKYTIEFIWQ